MDPNLDFWFENKLSGNPEHMHYLKQEWNNFVSSRPDLGPMLWFFKYFRQKWAKIAENCDHNIDPWDPCFVFVYFYQSWLLRHCAAPYALAWLTRCGCQLVAQNAAQLIFCQNKYLTFSVKYIDKNFLLLMKFSNNFHFINNSRNSSNLVTLIAA
jgi:hypothetical protein